MRDGSVVLVEIERQTVSRVLPDGTVQVIAHTGGGPNGLAVGPDGAFYVCNNGGFAWRLEENLFRPAVASSDYVGGRIERVDPRHRRGAGAVRPLRRQQAERAERHRVRQPWRVLFHRPRQDPRAGSRQWA